MSPGLRLAAKASSLSSLRRHTGCGAARLRARREIPATPQDRSRSRLERCSAWQNLSPPALRHWRMACTRRSGLPPGGRVVFGASFQRRGQLRGAVAPVPTVEPAQSCSDQQFGNYARDPSLLRSRSARQPSRAAVGWFLRRNQGGGIGLQADAGGHSPQKPAGHGAALRSPWNCFALPTPHSLAIAA